MPPDFLDVAPCVGLPLTFVLIAVVLANLEDTGDYGTLSADLTANI